MILSSSSRQLDIGGVGRTEKGGSDMNTVFINENLKTLN